MTLTDAMKDYIVEKGYDQKHGARPLHRAIQKYLEDPLSEYILAHPIDVDLTIEMDVKDNEVIIHALEQHEQ